MSINYLHPVFISDGEIRITAAPLTIEERLAKIKTQLFNSKGILCAEAEVVYVLFPEAVARRKYRFPGKDMFYNGE
jgi:acyl-CoA thioesterase FadM